MEGELWHLVEAKRDDGAPTLFRIRELDPRPSLDRIFVVEMPYPTTELSRLPAAAAYRRLAKFEEQWLLPACQALGWQLVGIKTEDGSFFLYMYGASQPSEMIARLAPFDAALGFYDDADPGWSEYSTLRELLDRAKALPPETPAVRPTRAKAKTRLAIPMQKPSKPAKPKKKAPPPPRKKPKAKAKAKPKRRR